MTSTVKVKGLDNVIENLETMTQKFNDILETDVGPEISAIMYATAVKNAPVRTGRLRQSLTEGKAIIERDDGTSEVFIGITTNVEYAPYVEYGTGLKGDPSVPHVPKAFWFSKNPDFDETKKESAENRRYIMWFAQAPNPFMRKSLEQTKKIALKYMKDGLAGVFE